nr:reverse transcriptase domain-containing protein [Tanacetum cinerariifolium]
MMSSFIQMHSPLSSRSLPSDTVANPRGDVKAITTRSGEKGQGAIYKFRKYRTCPTSVFQVPILEPEVISKPNPKPLIPYPSRLNNQKLQEKMNNQMLKFLQIFQRLNFDLSFADALLHMLKFTSTFKSLLSNKEKLFELESTPLNENCSAMLLKKFPEKLGGPDKFLIPCAFLELEECLALADLGTSFNLMPLSVWKKLSLPELTPTLNQINVIDVACEEYAQEVLGFLDSSTSGNPTPLDPIIATSSPLFTPFEGGDFILEEIETCLRTPNELSNLGDDYYDMEGDILYLEKLLNEDPSSNLPPMKNEDLKQVDVTMTKPSIEEPPELKLKDLPSHLEYAFLEGTDKLPIITSKELKDKEKAALLKGGMIVVENKYNELIPTRLGTGWRVCIDYQKLNDATHQDHFPLPFMDQMLKRLARNEYYCFLNGFSGYFQIPIDPQDQEKTIFTCSYGTFADRRMPFGLCNASGTFQRCMMAIFHDMIEETMEVFMDDFSIFKDSFSSCLSHVDKMLKMYEDTNLVLN